MERNWEWLWIKPKKLSAIPKAPFLEGHQIHLWILGEQDLGEFPLRRQALRKILSLYRGASPESIDFETVGEGKPRLKMPGAGVDDGFFFNASHSQGAFALAISREGELGIDLEKIRPVQKIDAFKKRFFHPSENAWIDSQDDRLKAFFQVWTGKEAWAKSRAQSVFQALSHFEWSDQDPRFMSFSFDQGESDYIGQVCADWLQGKPQRRTSV